MQALGNRMIDVGLQDVDVWGDTLGYIASRGEPSHGGATPHPNSPIRQVAAVLGRFRGLSVVPRVARLTALLAWAMVVTAAPGACAQDWAEKMFNKLEHNFGTVARGSHSVYRFEIINLYKQDMNVVGVRSSCGCTSPTIENPIIRTHEKAYVVAKFNTHENVGQKGATLFVTFGHPYPAEVQLRVHGRIRGDVVFSPGAVDFGDVDEGTPHEKKVQVSYAGRPTWEIENVTNDNDDFEVELKEESRNGGQINYNLLVRLKPNVPAGHIKDQLTVVTNDDRVESRRIPLVVSAHVRPEFSVTPVTLVLEKVKPGDTVTRKIVVRGRNPFRVERVDCDQKELAFAADNEEPKTVHFIDVRFTASLEPGEVRAPVQIFTDRGPDRCAECIVHAAVVAPDEGAKQDASGSVSAPKVPGESNDALSKAAY